MKRSVYFDRLIFKRIFKNTSFADKFIFDKKEEVSSKIKKLNYYDKQIKNFFKKNSLITKNIIGERVYIYIGKEFLSLKITAGMVGYKFGEFFFLEKPKII